MKVVPEHFFQLYTIHARRDEYTLPWGSVYARFQGKTEETYEKIHAELLKLESESNPTSIMVDFEKAEMMHLKIISLHVSLQSYPETWHTHYPRAVYIHLFLHG